MVQSLTSGIAWNSLSLRLKKGMAILCLAALTGANVQFEFQKFATPPLASAQTPSQCSDNVDNDGDGMVDMQDPGCSDPGDNSEFNIGGGNGGGNGGGGQSSVPPLHLQLFVAMVLIMMVMDEPTIQAIPVVLRQMIMMNTIRPQPLVAMEWITTATV